MLEPPSPFQTSTDGEGIVVCVGDALVDLIVRLDDLPPRGRAVWAPPPTRAAGGTAANVAAGLARLGQSVAFVGRVGDDESGHFLRSDLAARGVDVCGMATGTAETGAAISLVEPDGERTFLACALGAAHTHLEDGDVRSLLDRPPTAVFLTGLLLLEEPARGTTLRLAASLRDAGVTIYFDPNLRQPAASMPRPLREAMMEVATLSDVVLAGDNEARDLDLAPWPGRRLAIKRGAEGATLWTACGERLDTPGHAVNAVDATGAGDAFDAAFIAASVGGRGEWEAVEFANAAAALSVEQLSARGMPSRDEVLRLIETRRGA